MGIYTRTGDGGKTSVIRGRVDKDHARVEAYGTVDELNTFLSSAIRQAEIDREAELAAELTGIQQYLFDCSHDLAVVSPEFRPYRLAPEAVEQLERRMEEHPPAEPLQAGYPDNPLSARLMVCRGVCRRAERRIVTLMRDEIASKVVLQYINRLSTYLWWLADRVSGKQGER
ncbi:cob(I)yrinic acid a,c-diamide adenosyltransferase [Paenibacillus dendritiformis]|uniref:cob(I)yrinic acid a,c-diamide adenosyltransferase n=1 Tax=Paenibacillus dendritiformis TaxID=130049 RepID=UPI000DA902C9|nr:cob(I)yrinic acid a,c-diamide adenosyltransferase [Paenibacillus dendritiformis]PZM64445.1 cob(I)yrinic acid a,c-diamide adenosyltransferase [Paenibacillus dendritiformis]